MRNGGVVQGEWDLAPSFQLAVLARQGSRVVCGLVKSVVGWAQGWMALMEMGAKGRTSRADVVMEWHRSFDVGE